MSLFSDLFPSSSTVFWGFAPIVGIVGLILALILVVTLLIRIGVILRAAMASRDSKVTSTATRSILEAIIVTIPGLVIIIGLAALLARWPALLLLIVILPYIAGSIVKISSKLVPQAIIAARPSADKDDVSKS